VCVSVCGRDCGWGYNGVGGGGSVVDVQHQFNAGIPLFTVIVTVAVPNQPHAADNHRYFSLPFRNNFLLLRSGSRRTNGRPVRWGHTPGRMAASAGTVLGVACLLATAQVATAMSKLPAVITGLAPNYGSKAGGTYITIKGAWRGLVSRWQCCYLYLVAPVRLDRIPRPPFFCAGAPPRLRFALSEAVRPHTHTVCPGGFGAGTGFVVDGTDTRLVFRSALCCLRRFPRGRMPISRISLCPLAGYLCSYACAYDCHPPTCPPPHGAPRVLSCPTIRHPYP